MKEQEALQEALIELFAYCHDRTNNDNKITLSSDVKKCIYEFCSQKISDGAYVIFNNVFKAWIFEKYSNSNSNSNSDKNSAQSFSIYDYLDPSFFDEVTQALKEIHNYDENNKELDNCRINCILDVLKSSAKFIGYNVGLFLAQKSTETAQKGIAEKTKQESKDLKNKLNKQQQKNAESSITILGIFVGIVMVFFGGFSILTEAITTMNVVTPYRLIFTMLAFGFIMYNIVILLFFLIGKITNKSIQCKCHKCIPKDEKSGLNCANCKANYGILGICKLQRLYPYIYWGNTVIISGMSFIFSMWIHFKMVGEVKNLQIRILIGSIAAVAVVLAAWFLPYLAFILKIIFKQFCMIFEKLRDLKAKEDGKGLHKNVTK